MSLPYELQPCLPGSIIIKHPTIQPTIMELRRLVSAPLDVYQALYGTTLRHFMEFCQAMPFAMSNPVTYSLLQRRLELAVATLKLRRGKMLPVHAGSEMIAEQEPLWTYALFTVALLASIHQIQDDRSVDLYKNINERIGLWHPFVGRLYEPETYYKLINRPQALHVQAKTLQTAIVRKIMPSVGLRWLSSCHELFSSWFEAMMGTNSSNVLTQLICQAKQAIDFPQEDDVQEQTPQTDNTTQAPTPSDSSNEKTPTKNTPILPILNQWLAEHVTKDSNQSAEFIRVPQGLLITLSGLEAFVKQQPVYNAVPTLITALEPMLHKVNDQTLYRYRSTRLEQRHVVEGVIIDEQYLTDTVREYPPQTEFIPYIPL